MCVRGTAPVQSRRVTCHQGHDFFFQWLNAIALVLKGSRQSNVLEDIAAIPCNYTLVAYYNLHDVIRDGMRTCLYRITLKACIFWRFLQNLSKHPRPALSLKELQYNYKKRDVEAICPQTGKKANQKRFNRRKLAETNGNYRGVCGGEVRGWVKGAPLPRGGKKVEIIG